MLHKLNIADYKPQSSVAHVQKQQPRFKEQGTRGPQSNFTRIPNRIINNPLLDVKEKMILISLHYHSFSKGHCKIAVETLWQELGIRKDTIYKILKSLETQQYIKGHKTFGRTTDYMLSSFGN
jgi:hypothetical protein